MYILENKIITLRSLEPEDLDLLFEAENNRKLWEISNTISPYSRDLLTKYIAKSHLDIYEAKQLRLVIALKEDPKAIGFIDLFDFDPQHLRAGIGIIIFEEQQNKGYASQALYVLLSYAFEDLGLHQVFAHIPEKNLKSKKLFKKHGFIHSGTMKDWVRLKSSFIDVEILQLLNPNAR